MKILAAIALSIGLLGSLTGRAQTAADSVAVKVKVEVTLPDSVQVTKTVTTRVPQGEVGAAVERVLNINGRISAADGQYGRSVSSQVYTERPVAIYNNVVAEGTAEESDSVAVAEAVAAMESETVATVQESQPGYGVPAPVDSVVELLAVDTPVLHSRSQWGSLAEPTPQTVKFAWGAEAGTSIDMTGQDMSTIDINAMFGMNYRWINFLGIGAGANMMVSNSCRTYPVFMAFRTEFSQVLRLVFMDVRGGVDLNYLPNNASKTSAYASASIGFYLATRKTFRSYITAGYTFNGRGSVDRDGVLTHYTPLHMAGVRLGVQF